MWKPIAALRLACCFLGCLGMASMPLCAQAPKSLSLQRNDWTIECDLEQATLNVSMKGLGRIASNLQFQEETAAGVRRVQHLTGSINSEGELLLESTEPRTAWVIAAAPGNVTITATDFHGVLTGLAASGAGRNVAVLLDPEGEPVKWEGTDEVASGWGGAITSHPSYLPRLHPEVMHVGLGHVSGAGMHSLFDRRLDTAIDFGANARLEADAGNGESYKLTLPVQDRATIAVTPDYFTRVLGVPFYVPYDDSFAKTAPIVWSSWTGYYETVTERDMVRNTDWLAEKLKAYGLEYVVLDDGYDRLGNFDSQDVPGQPVHEQSIGHAWIENWNHDRFPHGPEWLTGYIHGKGLKAGLWMVPNAYGSARKQHPEWYLYDKQGKTFVDYSTPALDSTHPQVLDLLQHIFTRLDGMGFDYYKFDGEAAIPEYAPSIERRRLYAPSANFIENYRQRMAVIRNTIGPERFIEECPAGTPLNAIGYVDSYFNGQDVYSNWQGMYALFSSIGDNLFFNHYLSYVMPGEGLELAEPMTVEQAKTRRPQVALDVERAREDPFTGFGMTTAEARTAVTYVSLTGVAYPLASVMPDLPEARVRLLQATMPTLPILPIDLYSRGTDSRWDTFKHVRADYYIHHYPEVLDLKVNSGAGMYDVAAETNWRGETAERRLTFDQLGLDLDRDYVVFDFWNQRPLGTFRKKIDLSIDAHDTRVLLIHPLAARPQLIGNSRHISGTYSVLSQAWSESEKTLHGESAGIAGEPYTLWFHVPAGYRVRSVQATSKSGKQVQAEWKMKGEFGSVRFLGEEQPVAWRVGF